jgi:hypothetical protein
MIDNERQENRLSNIMGRVPFWSEYRTLVKVLNAAGGRDTELSTEMNDDGTCGDYKLILEHGERFGCQLQRRRELKVWGVGWKML